MVPAGVYKMAMAIIFFLTVQETFTLGGATISSGGIKKGLPFYTPLPAPFPSELLEISCVHCPISGPFANRISSNSCCWQTNIYIHAADQTLWSAGADQRLWSPELLPKSNRALANAGWNIWSVLPKGLGSTPAVLKLCLHGSHLTPTGLLHVNALEKHDWANWECHLLCTITQAE